VAITIVYTDAGGVRAYVRGKNGIHLDMTEDISAAQEFASGAAATAFTSGCTPSAGLTQLSVTGIVNPSRKTHT
jgi:hypothetical protein